MFPVVTTRHGAFTATEVVIPASREVAVEGISGNLRRAKKKPAGSELGWIDGLDYDTGPKGMGLGTDCISLGSGLAIAIAGAETVRSAS